MVTRNLALVAGVNPREISDWDFLARHKSRFAANPRMAIAIKNVRAIVPGEQRAIADRAETMQRHLEMLRLEQRGEARTK